MKTFRTYQKLLPLFLIVVFFSVPLVTHADLNLNGIILSIAGYILWIGAKMLDASVTWFILGMGGLITGSSGIGIGPSIDLIWTTVRDLVNLTFIFGLVYVGFKTILNAGTDTKNLLASILIGALLVNFSLFISKVVIDVSNITASEIYKAMGVGVNATQAQLAQFSISEQFMTRMGITNLVAVPDPSVKDKISTKPTDSSIAFVVGASIFILVTAFVFAAGAILIAIRFGVLVILMMLSPIFFAATVFPVFRGWRDKWIHSLFSQAFFAPAYLFMIFVTLKVADGYYKETRGFEQMYNGMNKDTNFSTIIFFSLTIVLMIASLILAKQMGAIGGARALAAGKKIRGYATGFAGRNIIGRASASSLKKREALGISSTSNISRALAAGAGAKYGGSLSFKETQAAGKAASQVKARRAQTTAIASAIAAGATDPVGMERAISGASNDQLLEMVKGKAPGNPQYDAIVHNMSASQFDAVMNAKPEDLDDRAKAAFGGARKQSVAQRIQENARAAATAATPPRIIPATPAGNAIALKEGINRASAAQLKVLGAGVVSNHAADIKQSQFDDIMKGKDFTETEQAAIAKARRDGLIKQFMDAVASGTANTFLTELDKKDKDAIPKLPSNEILTHIAAIDQMTPNMLARMQNELDGGARTTIRNRITRTQPTTSPAHHWLTTLRGAEF